jgi:tRNA(Ile)-lysidine synthase
LTDDWLEKNYGRITEFRDNALHFKIGALKDMSNDLKGEIFKEGLERNFSVQITFNDFRKFSSLLNKQAGRKENLSGNLSALREREEILILKNSSRTKFIPVEIKVGDEIKLNGRKFIIRECYNSFEFNKKSDNEYISGDNLSGIFTLRTWRPGDRFNPLGLKGSKKVSDFLNERKIPSYLKKNQLVLSNKNRIVWVLGLRIDDRFKIERKTKKVLQLCLK